MANSSSDSMNSSQMNASGRMAGRLLTRLPYPNQPDIDRDLFEAVAGKDANTVRYLLTKRPRPTIDARSKKGYSALELASESNKLTMMQLLVNMGHATLSSTALNLAVQGGCLEAIAYLLGTHKDTAAYVNCLGRGQTALHHAFNNGNCLETIRYLIDLGADAAMQDSQGRTPAHYACSQNATPLSVLKFLVHSAEESMNKRDCRGQTCLHISSNKGKREYIEWLVENGADARLKDKKGRHAAHYISGQPDHLSHSLGLLIRSAGGINDQDVDGETCLHIAAAANNGEHVDWLLANGAEASTTDICHRTAWELAIKQSGFDAIGQFARREVDCRDGSMYRASHPAYKVPMVRQRRGKIIEWHYIRAGTIKVLVYSQLARVFSKYRPKWWSIGKAVEKVEQSFQEATTTNSTREPSCIVENFNHLADSPFEPGFVSLVMPYFDATSLEALSERSARFEELAQSRRCCNSATLDFRNRDQVILRYLKEKSDSWSEKSLSLVTVPQAWLWKFDHFVVTALPSNTSSMNSLDLNMERSWSMSSILRNDYTKRTLGCFLADLVDALDRPVMAGLQEPIFNIFEKAIADLSERVDKYTQSPDVDSINIAREKLFLHEIDDVREELSMIKTVLFQQEEVWREFATKAWPLYWPDGHNGLFKPRPMNPDERGGWATDNEQQVWNKIQRPQTQFVKFKRRIEKLDENAARVERAIDRKLDLKTKHASLKEAHTMAIMSAAVFGFTIITIIFTPLSFIVTLFALPVDRFQKQQAPSVWTDQAGMYSTTYIARWIVTVELISIPLTLIVVWLMVEYGLRVPITDWIKNWAHRKLRSLLQKIQRRVADENVPPSSKAADAENNTGKGQSRKEAKVPINASDPDGRHEKRQAKRRRWFRRQSIRVDEENGTDNGNHQYEE